jgi:predicted anti-sigma-YlaC factor YlaD
LEALLAAEQGAAELESLNVTDHLAECPECAGQLATMKAQSQMIRLLRAPEELEPVAGFYARVLQKIEERAKESMWASLIYSPLSSRIAYASLTVALLLGSYVIAAETRDGDLMGRNVARQTAHYDAPVVGSPSQQRDAVLENFAAH